ncbi:MAG: putative porin [Pseudomonadota bacterium]|nr:putative porin [Pseudomonadota bacterium]
MSATHPTATLKGMTMICSTTRRSRLKPALMACAAGLSLLASPAFAQERRVDGEKILELLVARGVITQGDADTIISQAEVAEPAPQQQAAIPPGGVTGDTQTIPYIPQTVRNQIKEELRTELATQASTEGWARPGEVAEWTKRLTLFGDIRVRGEGVRMADGNFNRSIQDFQATNAGGGYDISPSNLASPPALNTTEDRYRARIRARLGLHARIDDWITGEVRIATGAERSPVSTNQTLGGNGEFGKYAIWLDRANIRLTPLPGVDLAFGRFANPFWTSEMLFDEDLNFDGVAASLTYPVTDRLSVFANAGAFPIFNTDFNFGSTDAGAFSSKDKYLLAGQLGAEFKPVDDVRFKLAAGYFRFEKVEGRESSPCFHLQDVCDTDATRPQFMQFGNTVFPIRNIIPDPIDPQNSPEVQYFGLASKYEVLNVHGQLDLGFFSPIGIRLEGDFVKNLAFNRNRVAALAVNNFSPTTLIPNPDQDPSDLDDDFISIPGTYDGGDTGWYANLVVGKPDLAEPGDWRVSLGYRRVETDAVLDAFADSDFHLGGTNAKGWILGGAYAIGKNTEIGARWLSSDVITGVPYSNDVVQIDLSTRF